jgi:predicted Zn-ribbon and HTH transcriptional regulator
MRLMRKSDEERFWEKVEKTDTCWLWTAALEPGGYGVFWYDNGEGHYAHRFSYQTFVGPLTPGMVLDHLCRVRRCVRPLHLEQVTYQVNRDRTLPVWEYRPTCPAGHVYDEVDSRGSRRCSLCRKQKKREWYARNAEKINSAAKARRDAKTYFEPRTCARCGEKFQADPYKHTRFCGHACATSQQWEDGNGRGCKG